MISGTSSRTLLIIYVAATVESSKGRKPPHAKIASSFYKIL